MSTGNDIAPKVLRTKILEKTDDLSTFACDKDDPMGLDEFIHEEAIQFQKEKLGITHLFLYKEQIVGFATLAMSEIEVKEAPSLLSAGIKVKNFPALLIGLLAVHNDYRDRHVGRIICLWCLEIAKELSREVGCRLVVVLTEGKTVEFYKKSGFTTIPKYEKKERKWMYIQVP